MGNYNKCLNGFNLSKQRVADWTKEQNSIISQEIYVTYNDVEGLTIRK